MMKPRFKSPSTPRLSQGEADRQGRVTRLAIDRFGAPAAVAFLNSHNEELGGRPLNLAIVDEAGCLAVETVLKAHAPQV